MITIQAVEVVRDEYGFWTHPQYPAEWDESTTFEEIQTWLDQYQLEYRSIDFESDAPEGLQDAWGETGEADCSKWQPSPPSGEGWFVFAIYDTEDGPVCIWMRQRIEGGAQP